MIYRNRLGTFSFDDNVQESHMKLVVQSITGQYLNPKPREPELTDEQSCYDYIMSNCGNVLAIVPFDLEINEDIRIYTKEQLVAKKIRDFDNKVKQITSAFRTFRNKAKLTGHAVTEFGRAILEDPEVGPVFASMAQERRHAYLVGPASLVK